MSFEEKVNYQLNKYPFVKKIVKNLYQHIWVLLANNQRCEGNIVRVSPNDTERLWKTMFSAP